LRGVLFDLIAVGLLLLLVAMGALRGTLAGFLRVANLACAYFAGFFAATHLGKVAALLLGRSRLMTSALVGAGAFLAVYLVGSIIAWLLIRRERSRREDQPRSAYDRLGGACFGALQASLAILLLAVLGSFVDAAYRAGLPQGSDQSGSFLVAHTRTLVSEGLEGALGDSPGAKFTVKLVADPGSAVLSAQGLLSSDRFASLQHDSLFWDYVTAGDVDSALEQPSFMAIMNDDALRGKLVDLGFVDESARQSPSAFRSALRASLLQAAPRLRAIREDPGIGELAAKPAIQKALESGDTVALLAQPEFRALVDRVLRDYEREPAH
jgi:uncharacterized membrane protein required for colicin V production